MPASPYGLTWNRSRAPPDSAGALARALSIDKSMTYRRAVRYGCVAQRALRLPHCDGCAAATALRDAAPHMLRCTPVRVYELGPPVRVYEPR